jgi:hypothetical protein
MRLALAFHQTPAEQHQKEANRACWWACQGWWGRGSSGGLERHDTAGEEARGAREEARWPADCERRESTKLGEFGIAFLFFYNFDLGSDLMIWWAGSTDQARPPGGSAAGCVYLGFPVYMRVVVVFLPLSRHDSHPRIITLTCLLFHDH